MRKFALLSANLAAMLVALLPGTPAQALNNVSFVSSTGTGSACTRAAPCPLLGDAISATAPGGEINCVDSGSGLLTGFMTIQKSITIDCAGTATVTGSIQINGAGIVVKIRNLTITGLGSGGISGIDFVNGAALFVENCVIQFFVIPEAPIGIWFRPNGPGKLVVTDTAVVNNGSGAAGAGILVKPQAGGSARVHLERVSAQGNVFGIVADGTGSTAGINMTVADSVSSGNTQDGIIAVTPGGGAPIGIYVKNTKSTNNAIGIRSIGPNVTVRVDGSSAIGNGTGLSFSGGGALLSAGNNMVEANGSNGAFSGSVALK